MIFGVYTSSSLFCRTFFNSKYAFYCAIVFIICQKSFEFISNNAQLCLLKCVVICFICLQIIFKNRRIHSLKFMFIFSKLKLKANLNFKIPKLFIPINFSKSEKKHLNSFPKKFILVLKMANYFAIEISLHVPKKKQQQLNNMKWRKRNSQQVYGIIMVDMVND